MKQEDNARETDPLSSKKNDERNQRRTGFENSAEKYPRYQIETGDDSDSIVTKLTLLKPIEDESKKQQKSLKNDENTIEYESGVEDNFGIDIEQNQKIGPSNMKYYNVWSSDDEDCSSLDARKQMRSNQKIIPQKKNNVIYFVDPKFLNFIPIKEETDSFLDDESSHSSKDYDENNKMCELCRKNRINQSSTDFGSNYGTYNDSIISMFDHHEITSPERANSEASYDQGQLIYPSAETFYNEFMPDPEKLTITKYKERENLFNRYHKSRKKHSHENKIDSSSAGIAFLLLLVCTVFLLMQHEDKKKIENSINIKKGSYLTDRAKRIGNQQKKRDRNNQAGEELRNLERSVMIDAMKGVVRRVVQITRIPQKVLTGGIEEQALK